jgi:hypothetical protein
MGVLSPKPIAAVIRFIPNSIKAIYSKRPNIKRKPQKRAVYVVNQEAKTINNPFFVISLSNKNIGNEHNRSPTFNSVLKYLTLFDCK